MPLSGNCHSHYVVDVDGIVVVGKAKILVVDDSVSLLETIVEILRGENYQVLIATDFQSAWDIFQKKIPDLVISDVYLSRMEIEEKWGLELMEKIRQHAKQQDDQCPVILMSSSHSVADIVGKYSSEPVSFLAKPFDPENLLEIISQYCN